MNHGWHTVRQKATVAGTGKTTFKFEDGAQDMTYARDRTLFCFRSYEGTFNPPAPPPNPVTYDEAWHLK